MRGGGHFKRHHRWEQGLGYFKRNKALSSHVQHLSWRQLTGGRRMDGRTAFHWEAEGLVVGTPPQSLLRVYTEGHLIRLSHYVPLITK